MSNAIISLASSWLVLDCNCGSDSAALKSTDPVWACFWEVCINGTVCPCYVVIILGAFLHLICIFSNQNYSQALLQFLWSSSKKTAWCWDWVFGGNSQQALNEYFHCGWKGVMLRGCANSHQLCPLWKCPGNESPIVAPPPPRKRRTGAKREYSSCVTSRA